MKKTLIALLCTFIALPAVADNYIKFKASAIEDTINTMVPESHRASAADEYQKQMDSTTGKISVMGIYKVCAAAGFNINNTNGYNGCRLFINTIAEKSGFGSGSANQQNCKTKFNGIWTVIADGTEQCVGRDGHKLVYHALCDGAGGDCIRDFATLQTQEPNAREFIQAYGQQKNLQFTCWYTYDSRRDITSPLGQDYIKCSAGGKAYEFEFDDLIQDPGETAVESENTAMCEMFGGKIVKHPDSSIEKQWQSCEVSREICNGPLHNLAIKIGHNVMYQGYCRLSRTVKETSVVGLKTLPGVDSRVFYNTGAQMRSGMAKQQTEEYLRTKFPNETYINCDPNPKILNEGFGIDLDYVMTCTVGSKQVDFIFHDLTEGNDARAATGMDAMQCIISGGTFKGESCRGPTQAECDALDAALRAKGSSEGAKWDDDIRACIMGNAMKTYKRDVTTGYIVGAVVIVGGTIAVIGTGGAAAPAIVGGAEMLVTDLAINWAIDANHRRLSQGAATRFVNFVEDADKCTTEACALKVLQSHYATLSGVMNDLNKDDLAVVDTTMERLFGLIQTEFVACGKNDIGQTVYANPADCAMQQSHLKIMDYIDPVSEPVLIIASIAYNPGYVTNKFMKLKKISKLAKLDDAADIKQTGVTVLNGLDPNFTKGTSLDATDLRFQLETTRDWRNARLNGDNNITQGLLPDVSTAVNKHYANERNILFMDAKADDYADGLLEQIDNGANTDKLITGIVDMTDPTGKQQLERIVQTIQDGQIKDAVIPFSGPGHQMTIMKQGDTWTVLDQFAVSEPEFVKTKNAIIDVLSAKTNKTDKIVINKYQVCDNTTGSCALFSQGMGRAVLEDQVNIADEIRYLNSNNMPMNQNIVDGIVDQMDRDVGQRILDMLE
ncbi:MAG: hypothetical protein IKB10_03395 [Alphaproteobacteria bacterium]|nr:hypothetical protein [Alphaproteobacteria bacterium]